MGIRGKNITHEGSTNKMLMYSIGHVTNFIFESRIECHHHIKLKHICAKLKQC